MKRIAAYCRVSTDKGDQALSLENQQSYFEKYISEKADFELFGIYADEGLSGTSVKKRAAFNRMIRDAADGCFDLIITKEISRFARNTLDSIFYTRYLKNCGVGVIFLTDGINTLDADSELRLAIISSIAQEESRRTSERVKWGQARQMEKGVVFGSHIIGYTLKDGGLIPNEYADTVRRIFYEYVCLGHGARTIANRLNAEEIPLPSYMKEWSHTCILRILKNEKYCGDLSQGKSCTVDYLTHQRINSPQGKTVYLKDHHTPIIGRDIFHRAQEIMKERCTREQRYSSAHCFSGKIVCGLCKGHFVSRSRRLKGGDISRSWRCASAVKHSKSACSAPSVREKDLQNAVLFAFHSLDFDRKRVDKDFAKLCGGDSEMLGAANGILGGSWNDVFFRELISSVTVNGKRISVEFNSLSSPIELSLDASFGIDSRY